MRKRIYGNGTIPPQKYKNVAPKADTWLTLNLLHHFKIVIHGGGSHLLDLCIFKMLNTFFKIYCYDSNSSRNVMQLGTILW